MKITRITFSLALLLCASVSHAGLINGDFSAGSTGWTVGGDVVFDGSTARLTDGHGYSILYQAIKITPNAGYNYQFDWSAVLGGSLTGASTPALFFPSLYFVNDLSQLSLDPSNLLFDAVIHMGSVSGPFDNGGNFQMYFTAGFEYVIPVFELAGGQTPGSSVIIDNVELVDPQAPIVPEPATLALVACGLAGLGFRFRRVHPWHDARYMR